jgi:outer membrane receptor protein involved in Fe transport
MKPTFSDHFLNAIQSHTAHKGPQQMANAPVGLSALAAAVAMVLAGSAVAQEQVLEEVTVTGSRITRTTGFTTATPVTAVTTEELNTFEPGTTLAEQLDQLPQFFQTESAQRGGGALFGGAGRSNVNLRAMGAQRTLVLLDGARITPGDRDGSVHIDNIPSALLSQIEVVTGGASAAYGADALAGVVNFRLNREYTGFDVDFGMGATDDGYGDNREVSVTFGSELSDKWGQQHAVGR